MKSVFINNLIYEFKILIVIIFFVVCIFNWMGFGVDF